MSTTFNALAFNITALREQGILKRVRGTPLPTSAYLAGISGSAVTNTVLQILIITISGHLLFGLDWPQDWLSLWLFVVVGVICFASLGVSLSHAIPNFDAAPAYVNAAFLPMIFISGVFYDENVAPKVIGDVAQALPLKHLIDGLQGVDRQGRGRGPPPRRAARARRLGDRRPHAGDPRLLLGVALDLVLRHPAACRPEQAQLADVVRHRARGLVLAAGEDAAARARARGRCPRRRRRGRRAGPRGRRRPPRGGCRGRAGRRRRRRRSRPAARPTRSLRGRPGGARARRRSGPSCEPGRKPRPVTGRGRPVPLVIPASNQHIAPALRPRGRSRPARPRAG